MGRVVLRLAALLAAALGTVVVILAVVATRRLNSRYDVPAPPIARATSPEALARGERLYRSACASCHTGAGETRSCGAPIRNFPASFGTVYASNLTSDPEHGIGRRSDGDIARLLRHGVLSDGRFSRSMPRLKRLGDDDIAALIGFLRSANPLFAACARPRPRAGLTLFGTVALAFFSPGPQSGSAGASPGGPAGPFAVASIPVPAPGPNAAYGRYLATAIYGCVDCHTEGLADLDTKLTAKNLLAGGLELPDPRGDPIESTNLTPDDSGIQKWTLADFQRALSTGINPTGLVVRSPMPIFRFCDPVELEAIFNYLRTVPAARRETRVFQARQALPPGPSPPPPEELFVRLACATCHGAGSPFREQLRQAARKPASVVARAIRHPEETNPGTQMPTFATLVDDVQAESLARWLAEIYTKPLAARGP